MYYKPKDVGLFNKFFSSVFTKEDLTSCPQFQSDCCFSALAKITQLNSIKAPGPEGWPLFCVRESAQELFVFPCPSCLTSLWSVQHYQDAGR